MPPKSKLPPEEIATLTEWVQRGAPWGIGTRTAIDISRCRQDSGHLSKEEFAARARFWSFQPLARDAPAREESHASWARNPIDRFILAALEQKTRTGTRSRQANIDPPPIVRPDRASPEPADVEAFLKDRAARGL